MRESWGRRTDIGHDTREDDLALVGGSNGALEGGIVPGVDCGSVGSDAELCGWGSRVLLPSPWRMMSGASGYISRISFGSGPLGPLQWRTGINIHP